MILVYHHPLCAFSRKLRILLAEKSVGFELIQEQFWKFNPSFLKLNPAGMTPVIQTDNGITIVGNNAIAEYLDDVYPLSPSICGDALQRAEIRRIEEWFDVKFFNEVTRYIFQEKVVKTITRESSPNSVAIQAGKRNLISHLKYIEFLTADDRYLAGDIITRCDFAAAAQISVLDFLNDVDWKCYPKLAYWYSLVKSRPSFKGILNDIVPGFSPPRHYASLDDF